MNEGQTDEPQTDREFIYRFEVTTAISVKVESDEEARIRLARNIIEHLQAISDQAVELLELFLRDRGEFNLETITVFATRSENNADFSLFYQFNPDKEVGSIDYSYTYFEVYFFHNEPPQPPFWPHKFMVGFY